MYFHIVPVFFFGCFVCKIIRFNIFFDWCNILSLLHLLCLRGFYFTSCILMMMFASVLPVHYLNFLTPVFSVSVLFIAFFHYWIMGFFPSLSSHFSCFFLAIFMCLNNFLPIFVLFWFAVLLVFVSDHNFLHTQSIFFISLLSASTIFIKLDLHSFPCTSNVLKCPPSIAWVC